MLNRRRKVLCVATTDRLFSKYTRTEKPRCVPVQTMLATEMGHRQSESESELLYNWRSVSQFVLVSSPIWDFWPEIFFFSKLQSCLNWGALSDERRGHRQSRGRPCAPAYHHHRPSIHPSKPLNLFCRILYLLKTTEFNVTTTDSPEVQFRRRNMFRLQRKLNGMIHYRRITRVLHACASCICEILVGKPPQKIQLRGLKNKNKLGPENSGVRGCVVGWGTMLQSRKFAGSKPIM
jgi:hypothetical protein